MAPLGPVVSVGADPGTLGAIVFHAIGETRALTPVARDVHSEFIHVARTGSSRVGHLGSDERHRHGQRRPFVITPVTLIRFPAGQASDR